MPDGMCTLRCCSSACAGVRAIRSRPHFRHHQGPAGRRVPGVTVTVTNQATQQSAVGGHRRVRLLHLSAASSPGKYTIARSSQGFKKATRTERAARRRRPASTLDFALETGAMTEVVNGDGRSGAAADRRRASARPSRPRTSSSSSFSGRNPIGVAGLKAGVSGGAFNNRGFDDLGNGGFNINGSRVDENNITIDGATAIRTRSSGNIIGIQNVDAVQEVQVLTANYMPEYGRASGGQIRFVTKSGSNRFSGSASFFLRDESLQANTWARNRSTNPIENSGAGAVRLQAVRLCLRRSGPGRDVQEQAVLLRRAGVGGLLPGRRPNTATVPTEAMRQRRLQRAARTRTTGSSTARAPIMDPLTGQPFPGNIIPANRLSPNGLAFLNTYPLPTPGFRQGANNLIQTSDEPARSAEGQHPLRLPSERQQPVHVSLLGLQLDGGRRLPRHVPVRADRLGAPQLDARRRAGPARSRSNLINELTLHVLAGRRLHQRLHGRRALSAQPRRASTTRTSSRRRRRSTTRSRRSAIERVRRRSTAGRTRRSRPGRFTRSRT